MNHGSRNLTILGIAVVLFAIITTTISLALYHNSGDIYLDRSRPGFLPDEDEKSEDKNHSEQSYKLPETGKITAPILDDFLENYQKEAQKLSDNPFDPSQLSDASLGLPEEATIFD